MNVYRLRLAALPTGVVFGWDYPGSTLLRVRIVRGAAGDAERAAPGRRRGRRVAAPDPELARRCTGGWSTTPIPARSAIATCAPATRWRYAVFARDGDGPWVLWRDEVVTVP